MPDRVKSSFVIFGIRALRAERQSAPMSKITNDGLTRSTTGCFLAVPTWQQWASKVKISDIDSLELSEALPNTLPLRLRLCLSRRRALLILLHRSHLLLVAFVRR